MRINQIDDDSYGKEERESDNSGNNSRELIDKRVFIDMFVLYLDDWHLLLQLLLPLPWLDLCVDIWRQEQCSSLGEEEEVGVFRLDVVQADEERNQQNRVEYHVE